MLIDPDYDVLYEELIQKLNLISRRIDYAIQVNLTDETCKIIIIGHGYPKLVPKIKAVVEAAPIIPNWSVQALLQPLDHDELELVKQRLDKPVLFYDCELRMSEITFKLLSYDMKTKKVNISVYLGDDYSIDSLGSTVIIWEFLLILLGEMTLRRNIKLTEFLETPQKNKLSPLYELPQLIDSMYSNRGRRRVQ